MDLKWIHNAATRLKRYGTAFDRSHFLIAFKAKLAWMRTKAPIPERGRKPAPLLELEALQELKLRRSRP